MGTQGGRKAPEPSTTAAARGRTTGQQTDVVADRVKEQAEDEGRKRRMAVEDEKTKAAGRAAAASRAGAKSGAGSEARAQDDRSGGSGPGDAPERGGLEVRKPPPPSRKSSDDLELSKVPDANPDVPGPVVNPHERRNTVDAVSAAKQRYLDRKRKADTS